MIIIKTCAHYVANVIFATYNMSKDEVYEKSQLLTLTSYTYNLFRSWPLVHIKWTLCRENPWPFDTGFFFFCLKWKMSLNFWRSWNTNVIIGPKCVFLHKNVIMRKNNKDSLGVKWNMTIQLLCVVQWNKRWIAL